MIVTKVATEYMLTRRAVKDERGIEHTAFKTALFAGAIPTYADVIGGCKAGSFGNEEGDLGAETSWGREIESKIANEIHRLSSRRTPDQVFAVIYYNIIEETMSGRFGAVAKAKKREGQKDRMHCRFNTVHYALYNITTRFENELREYYEAARDLHLKIKRERDIEADISGYS